MKRLILLLVGIGTSVSTLPASAQSADYAGRKVTTRPVCEQRCNSSTEFPDNPRMNELQEKLAQVRYQVKLETDPDKRRELEDEEQRVLDRRERYLGRICTQICSSNPEQ